MKSGFQAWREAVTDRVRFWPDRAEIAQELTAHYEDHVKDLERLGYAHDLAETRALTAMGDPEEVGRAMDKVHQPWLGWLWMASKWAAICCVAVTVLYIETGGWLNIWNDLDRLPEEVDYEAEGYHSDPDSTQYTRVAVGKGTSVELCGYEISVPYAAIWKWSKEDAYSYYLSAVILAEDDRFWDDGPDGAMSELWGTDDQGGMYPPQEVFWEFDPKVTNEERDAMWAGYIAVDREASNPFCQTYWVRSRGMEEIPAWIELTSPNVEGLTLRMEWEVTE